MTTNEREALTPEMTAIVAAYGLRLDKITDNYAFYSFGDAEISIYRHQDNWSSMRPNADGTHRVNLGRTAESLERFIHRADLMRVAAQEVHP